MKIICTQENLRNGLNTVGRIISPSNTLPILNNLLLKTENGLLKISSTNLEVAISTYIRCKVEIEGEITVFSKTISDLVNSLPNANIVLETVNNELRINAERYHTAVKTMPPEEFPLIPEPEGKMSISVPAQDLKSALSEVIFATSTNQTQPEISGVFMSLENSTLTLVATDRYRLAEKKLVLLGAGEASQQVIVPQKTLAELSRIIGNQNENLEIKFSDNQVVFSLGSTQIISRLVDGQYPPYQSIIPQNFLTTIHTPKQPLINALKAGSIFSYNNNSITVAYAKDTQQLTITSESPDLGKSVVELPSEIEGESGELMLNHRYVLDGLGCLEAQNVIIKIINDSSPTIILPEGNNDYMYLVMPIKS